MPSAATGRGRQWSGDEYLIWNTDQMIERATALRDRGAIPVAILSVVEAPGGVRLRIRPVQELEDAEGVDILLDRILDCVEQQFNVAPLWN